MAGVWLFKIIIRAGNQYYPWYGFAAEKRVAVYSAAENASVRHGVWVDEEDVRIASVETMSEKQLYWRFLNLRLQVQILDKDGDQISSRKFTGASFYEANLDEPEVIWKLADTEHTKIYVEGENGRSIWITKIGDRIKPKVKDEGQGRLSREEILKYEKELGMRRARHR